MSLAARKTINHSLVAGAPGSDTLDGFGFEQVAADVAGPELGRVWHNTADRRLRWFDGLETETLAHMSDIVGAWRLRGQFSTNALPTVANDPTSPLIALRNGDNFVYTGALPVTITGIQGSDVLHAGDVLVLQNETAPAAAASWIGINRNLNDDGIPVAETVSVAVAADTVTPVAFTELFTRIDSILVLDGGEEAAVIVRRPTANTVSLLSSRARTLSVTVLGVL